MTAPRGSSGRHRLISGSFPALEPRLFDEIAALQKDDPLRPVAIVVTSNLLGVHLRRRYVEWREARGLSPAHGGISFSTLEAFAARIAGPGQPPLPPFGEFALISSALARLPEARVFGDLARRPELVPAIEATLRDLVDAGAGPKVFRKWVGEASLAPERRLLLSALARVYEDIERGTTPFETPAKTFRRAVGTRLSSTDPLLLYGFYDATGVQKEFLEAAARRRPVAAFIPRSDGALGDFADTFIAWAKERLPAAGENAPSPPGAVADFARRLGGDPAAPAPGEPVRLVSAAGAAGERNEIAREILLAVDDGVPLHATGIIVREPTAWSAALSRELSRAGIGNFEYRGATAAASPAGRAVRLWWNLEEADFPREDVLGTLDLLGSGRREEFRSPRALARRAGIAGGAADFSERPARLAAAAVDDRERRSAEAFAARCGRLLDSARDWPRAALPWSGWADEISRRLDRLFAPDEAPPALVAAAEAVASLGDLGGEVERESAAHVFFGSLEEQSETAGRIGVDGVFIGSAMASRGLTFDRTIVARLVENEFPLPGRPDPLFFDGERRAFAEATGLPVPLKVEPRAAEERQLFGIAAGSARSSLVLTAARRDEGLTRDRLPSPFFSAAERAAGRPARRTELGAPVAVGPSVSPAEAHDRALASHGAATVAAASPRFARALEREGLRHAPLWTAFEGRLGEAARSALERHRPARGKALSASRVAKFGTCPYWYFLRSIVELKPWEERDRPAELGPLALGNVFHDAARRAAAFTPWPPTEDQSAELARRAGEEALAAHEAAEAPLAPPLVREIARDRVEKLLLTWLAFERRRGDASRPAGAEVPLAPEGTPFLVDAGDFRVAFTGSIDRVDRDPDGRAVRVVDYKVKIADGFRKAFRGGERIVGGEAVQLPVYALASGGPMASEYLVLEAGDPASPRIEAVSFDPEETADAIGRLREFLAGMDAAIAAGIFAPRTSGRLQKEPCGFCDFAEVCGPGHEARFDAKDDDPSPEARALRALRDIP